jgi:hypothetical protein
MATDYEALAQYFGQVPKVPTADLAKFIVLNSKASDPAAFKNIGKDKSSFMGRIFDILSRPNYAVAEFAREWVETGNPNPNALWEGFSGQKKTTFSKVLKQAGMVDNDPAAAGLGLLGDIFLDPTTYIPIAGIANKFKKVREVPELPYAQKVLNRGEPVSPESFGLPTRSQEIPAALKAPSDIPRIPDIRPIIPTAADIKRPELTLDLPGVPKNIVSQGRQAPVEITQKETKGQLKFDLPEVQTAERIVDKLKAGDVETAKALVPNPPPFFNSKHQALVDEILKPNTKPGILSAKEQVSLWNKIENQVKNSDDIIKVYTLAEKGLINSGKVPEEGIKLSEVAAELVKQGITPTREIIKDFSKKSIGSELYNAIGIVTARNAVQDASKIKDIPAKVLEAKKTTENSKLLSDGQLKDFDSFVKKFSTNIAKAAGATPSGVKATSKLVDTILQGGKTAAQLSLEHQSKALDEIIASGKARPEVNAALTKALEKDLGTLPKWATHDNNAAEWFMGRVATWWGQKDLRPLSLNAIGSSAATAAVRGKVLDNLFEPFNQSQRHEAFNLAQGFGKASTPETEQLATQITRLMENLVGKESVLHRSGVTLDSLNKWIKQYKVGFEFTKSSKVTTKTGDVLDFSKGTDWINSWKTADFKDDPKAFLFRIQQAMEQATREKALFDEIGERFGSRVIGGEYRTKVTGFPYIEGYYFPGDIAKQLPRVVKDWSLPAWSPQSKLLQHYDRVLSMWKTGVTIYRPGHHVRNLTGDIYLGWMDGVNTLRPYILATKVQRSMRGAYKDLADVERLVQLGGMSKNFATPKPKDILFRNKSGVAFTSEQIAAVAHQKGLLEHTRSIEDIIDLGENSKFKPFGGKVQAVARGMSELTNHNTRLAHFIDKVAKSRGNDLGKIFEDASRRARKWHPTGLDLTEFERKTMRRIIPFYTWIRKSTPLLLEGLVMNPGKTVIPSKIYDAIQQAQGIDTPGRHDPFPVDQMFPEWIRAQGLGPLSMPEGFLGEFSNQVPTGYISAGVGLNPLADLMAQVEAPMKTIGSSMTPAFKIPSELMMGRKMFTGEPISGLDAKPDAFGQYVGEQIPIYSAFQGITGLTPFGGETKKSETSGASASKEALINWLTAAGIRGTGPYTKQAKYEINAEQKRKKDEFLEELKQRFGG